MDSIDLFNEVLVTKTLNEIADILNLHLGTVKRWKKLNSVPNNYYNDLNSLLNFKYPEKKEFRDRDQFYTTVVTANYCYNKLKEVLKELEINEKDYFYLEPSAGCCNFYKLLPENRRLGIDIEPKGLLKDELIKSDYLKYTPINNKKYIVIGNPPFGLRGNLALRFINHSYSFADVVAFILPPLFNSTGKGVPMGRIRGYKLAHSENLGRNSFEYPNGEAVDVATVFQVWVKIKTELIVTNEKRTCNTVAKVYSLSDGGTPSSTRNKKMLDRCHIYLPSTCFKGMKAYDDFIDLPNKRGYGVVFYKNNKKLINLFKREIDWESVSFISTNGALNLRTDLILDQLIERGYYDK